jgi:hypothetical protein
MPLFQILFLVALDSIEPSLVAKYGPAVGFFVVLLKKYGPDLVDLGLRWRLAHRVRRKVGAKPAVCRECGTRRDR